MTDTIPKERVAEALKRLYDFAGDCPTDWSGPTTFALAIRYTIREERRKLGIEEER